MVAAKPVPDEFRERLHIAKAHIRKEDVVAKVLAARGDAPGLVHVISAMESCATYKPWHDKPRGRTFLRPDTTNCLHYYFCINHKFGPCSVKLCDKFARILRIETTINDVAFFKHHRKVEHRTGHTTREVAPLKKSIYSLIDLREILLGCNQCYLEFLSSLDDHSGAQRLFERVLHRKPDVNRSFKGLNFFDRINQALLGAMQRTEFNIHGLARCDLMRQLPDLSPSKLSRQLHRLRVLGLLKRAANTYRYYLTRAGRLAIAGFERPGFRARLNSSSSSFRASLQNIEVVRD